MGQYQHITDLFLETGRKYREKTAIVHKSTEITFGELDADVRKTAAYLLRRGVRKGHRVLVLLPMSADLYRIILAINFVGAVAVLLDEWVSVSRMEECCRIVPPDAYVIVRKGRVLGLISKELRSIPISLGTTFPYDIPPLEDAERVPVEQPALITFTTGSSGPPKAVVRSYDFLMKQLEALMEEIRPQREEACLITLPVLLFLNLGLGATSIIADFTSDSTEKKESENWLEVLESNKVHRIIASPAFLIQLARAQQDRPHELSCLKSIFIGGSPVFPSDVRSMQSAFPDCEITVLYGSTEAEPISSVGAGELALSDPAKETGLLVGVPHPGIDVGILPVHEGPVLLRNNQSLADLLLPDGETGEIIVSGPHVNREYQNRGLMERYKIVDGNRIWHRTGDAGFLGRGHKIYLTGRCDSLIHRNGEWISPFLFREYASHIPGVKLGTLLESGGRILAIIQNQDRSREAEILEQVHLYPQDIDEIRFMKKIPLDPRHQGKIDDIRLKKMI